MTGMMLCSLIVFTAYQVLIKGLVVHVVSCVKADMEDRRRNQMMVNEGLVKEG